jgi:hypothetical protein
MIKAISAGAANPSFRYSILPLPASGPKLTGMCPTAFERQAFSDAFNLDQGE